MIHNVPQPAFEEFIASKLEKDPNVTIKKGMALVSSEEVTYHI
jgi:hypothetical protein